MEHPSSHKPATSHAPAPCCATKDKCAQNEASVDGQWRKACNCSVSITCDSFLWATGPPASKSALVPSGTYILTFGHGLLQPQQAFRPAKPS